MAFLTAKQTDIYYPHFNAKQLALLLCPPIKTCLICHACHLSLINYAHFYVFFHIFYLALEFDIYVKACKEESLDPEKGYCGGMRGFSLCKELPIVIEPAMQLESLFHIA